MPSTIGLSEPLVVSMKAVMTARIPAARARVEIDLGLAAGTIPDPAEITLGLHSNHAQYPAIEIESATHRIDLDSPNYLKSGFVIPIIAIVTRPIDNALVQDPEEDLFLLMLRYERIVIDAIMAGREAHDFVAGGIGFGVDLEGESIDYSPTRFIKGDLFARDIFIPTVCTIEEVRTP